MRRFNILILNIFILFCLNLRAQTQLKGKVFQQNSGWTAVEGIFVTEENSNGDYSKADGSFTLEFNSKVSGETVYPKIGLKVNNFAIDKFGKIWELVNERELEHVEIPIESTVENELKIIIAPKGQRDLVAQKYYRIIKTSADLALAQKEKEFLKLERSKQKDYEKINRLTSQLASLQGKADSITIYKEAIRIASINKDSAPKRILRYIELLNKGKSIVEAREALNIKDALSDIDKSMTLFNSAIQELETRARASTSIYDYKDALRCYEEIVLAYKKYNISEIKIVDAISKFVKIAIDELTYILEFSFLTGGSSDYFDNLKKKGIGFCKEAFNIYLKLTQSDVSQVKNFINMRFAYITLLNPKGFWSTVEETNEILRVLDQCENTLSNYPKLNASYLLKTYKWRISILTTSLYKDDKTIKTYLMKFDNLFNSNKQVRSKERLENLIFLNSVAWELEPNKRDENTSQVVNFISRKGLSFSLKNKGYKYMSNRYRFLAQDCYPPISKYCNDSTRLIEYAKKSLDYYSRINFSGMSNLERADWYKNEGMLNIFLKKANRARECFNSSTELKRKVFSNEDFAFWGKHYFTIMLKLNEFDSLHLNYAKKAVENLAKSNSFMQVLARRTLIEIYVKKNEFNSATLRYKENINFHKSNDSVNYTKNFKRESELYFNKLNERGLNQYITKNYNQAIKAYQEIIHVFGNQLIIYNNLGTAFVKNYQFEEAFTSFSEFQKLNPNNGRVYRNWGMYHALKNEPEKAFENLEKAIEFGFTDINWFETDDSIDNLRDDPKFKNLLLSLKNNDK
ncbi:tetratricopeptide repeat protein [Flavivirga eckloniae]|uniref:Uncharacterized protein n=1 Tax=Flavivirga eckloniae TaxID=1803846 RepID=A0A2K9PVX6_9FLAO|nr:hypothetical protein [Flavivirga eckloniae]AUP81231.1 hypothetical protein C1H87_21940 [Flavivirga eckloniae]